MGVSVVRLNVIEEMFGDSVVVVDVSLCLV